MVSSKSGIYGILVYLLYTRLMDKKANFENMSNKFSSTVFSNFLLTLTKKNYENEKM